MSQPTALPRRFPTDVFVACLVIAAAVLAFGLFIVSHPAWSATEVRIVHAVNAAHFPLMDAVALAINWVFGPAGVYVGVALVITVFALTRSAWSATRAALLLLLPWFVTTLMKRVVGRARPDPAGLSHALVPGPRSFSYPSGHTAFAAALVCAVVLSIAVRHVRRVSAIIGAVLVVLVGYSRVYLGVHYPSDTIASMIATPALAIACALLIASAGVFASAPYIGAKGDASSRFAVSATLSVRAVPVRLR